MHVLGRLQRRKLAADIITGVLNAAGHVAIVRPNELHMHDRYIAFYSHTTHSGLIFEDLAPTQDLNSSYCHFTGFAAFASIIQTSKLRLYNLPKRLGENELTSFIDDHGLLGYRAVGDNQIQEYEKLAKDLFYISLAPSNGQADQYLWSGFGEFQTGVRLELKFNSAGEIRKIFYAGKDTLLKRANQALSANGFPPLVPSGLSRMIAFYLPDDYSGERELRLLRKRYEGVKQGPWCQDGKFEFLPLDLGLPSSGSTVELLSVTLGNQADLSEAREVLAGSGFSQVPLRQVA